VERTWYDGRNQTYMTSECLPWCCPINGELTVVAVEEITGNIFHKRQLYKIFSAFFIKKKHHKLWGERGVSDCRGSLS